VPRFSAWALISMALLTLYRVAVVACAPFIRAHVKKRARLGKEDPARLSERWGQASASFPLVDDGTPTRPLWIHAASVGEATVALGVIETLHQTQPSLPVILTTQTVTSAGVVAGRLPQNVIHQYAPYDHPVWIARFLKTWKPRAALRIESEIWPNTLWALKKREIPTVLLNAHMSEKSYRNWRRAKGAAQNVMQAFQTIIADGDVNAARYRDLGAGHVRASTNIKFMNSPLPVDPVAAAELDAAVGVRPAWVYASTHADEENIAAQTHIELKRHLPRVLTMIAPRHPNRMPDILAQLDPLGLKIALRSRDRVPVANTDIFILDTMGELGTVYQTVPITMVGRSFSIDGGGGHNPIEPAHFGSYPVSGPHVQNVQTIFDTMITAKAAEFVQTPAHLTARLLELFLHLTECDAARGHAQKFVRLAGRKVAHDLEASLKAVLGMTAS
jgi:3-deoxy-D-manno-octulosonic-acid transferase